MKKLFLIMVATVMVACVNAKSVAASDSASKVSYNKEKFAIDVRDFSKALDLSYEQYDILEVSCKALNNKVVRATKAEPAKRCEAMNDALRENLSVAYTVLSAKQYHEYLSILNQEFNKTGMNAVLFGYEVADNSDVDL